MLPFQPNDELVFGAPTASEDHSFFEGDIISFSSGRNDNKLDETPRKRQTKHRDESDVRKVIMHRDVERKRREEMSNLYADLRSCLPLEHTYKGKRTVCDDIEKAAEYIKQMQKNVLELGVRRDKLKKISNLSAETTLESSSGSNNFPDAVMVNHILDGVLEILISQRVENSQFGISWILAELQQREVDIVSCVSTPIKGGFLHKIQIQARDMKSLDVSVLQDRLTKCLQVSEIHR